jgi:hypothetical protein
MQLRRSNEWEALYVEMMYDISVFCTYGAAAHECDAICSWSPALVRS